MLQIFSTNQEERTRQYFLVSVITKGLISFAECVAGTAAFFIPITLFTDLILQYAQAPQLNHSHSIILTILTHLAHELATVSGTFVAIYLLSRGLVKLVLVIALLKNKIKAYPISIAVIGLFVLYQIYQIITTFSWFLVALTLFDLFVIWTIWEEYKVLVDKGLLHSQPH